MKSDCGVAALVAVAWLLPAREHRMKVCFRQDTGNLRTLVTLDLDLARLNRAAGATGALHRPG